MGRIFFFVLGVGVTVAVVVKGRQLMRRATPAGVAEQVQRQADSLSRQAADFVDTITEAMRTRESELRSELGLQEPAEAHTGR